MHRRLCAARTFVKETDADEVSVNMAYRWFLGYVLNVTTPHFSKVKSNFRHRFTAKTIDKIFNWILDEIAQAGYLKPEAVFIDGTHIKANANTKKQIKEEVPVAAKRYAAKLMQGVNLDRENHVKKPFDYDSTPEKTEEKRKTIPQIKNSQTVRKNGYKKQNRP